MPGHLPPLPDVHAYKHTAVSLFQRHVGAGSWLLQIYYKNAEAYIELHQQKCRQRNDAQSSLAMFDHIWGAP